MNTTYELSEVIAQPVALIALAGTSPEVARADHEHDFLIGLLDELLTNNDLTLTGHEIDYVMDWTPPATAPKILGVENIDPGYDDYLTFKILADGTMLWGDGVNPLDTAMGRISSNTIGIATGDSLSMINGDIILAAERTVDDVDVSALAAQRKGFENAASDVDISWDDGTTTFTIQPASSGGDYFYWVNGIRQKQSTAQTLVGDGTDFTIAEGLWYIYYDNTNTLKASQLPFSFSDDCWVAYLYWDDTNSKEVYFGWEMHHYYDAWVIHEWAHDGIGCLWNSGLLVVALDDSGTGNDDDDAELLVNNGTIHDEDIEIDITDGSGVGPWNQELDPIAQIPVFYRDGANGYWRSFTADNFPVADAGKVGSGARIHYNEPSGPWTLDEVGNADFTVSWICASNNIDEPIICILDQFEYNTFGNAQDDADFGNLQFGDLPFKELKVLARVIYQTNTGYGNIPKARVREVLDLRAAQIGTAGGVVITTAHNSLSGRSETNAHPTTAIATNITNFNYSLSAADINVQLALDTLDDMLVNIPSGLATTPGLAFTGDSNTGIYHYAADQLGFSTAGKHRAHFTTTGVLEFHNVAGTTYAWSITHDPAVNPSMAASTNGILYFGDGSVAPWVSLSSTVNNRLDLGSGDSINITLGAYMVSGSTVISLSRNLYTSNGNALFPSQSFFADVDTGMYRYAANTLGFTTGGSTCGNWNTTALSNIGSFYGPNGSAASPTFSFTRDTDTGSYSIGANRYGIATAGILAVEIDATQHILGIVGTVARPTYSFTGDTDTGMLRGGANVLTWAAGGSNIMSINVAGLFINANMDLDCNFNGAFLKPRRVRQAAQPVPDANELMLWSDSDDNSVHLLYNDADAGVVELASG